MAETPREGRSDSIPAGSHDRLTRRSFIQSALIIGVAAAGVKGVEIGAHHTYEWFDNLRGRQTTESYFLETGLQTWRQFSVVPMMLQLDKSLQVNTSMFARPDAQDNIYLQPEGFVLAVQPIAIRQTILGNINNLDEATKRSVVRALPDIRPSQIGFYQPNGGSFVFCDVDNNEGLITPITDGGIWSGQELGVSDFFITGRSLQGDVVYPYTSQLGIKGYPYGANGKVNNPVPEATYDIIGHSVAIDDYNSLLGAVDGWIYDQKSPVKLPH
jgi:hypothetical protein